MIDEPDVREQIIVRLAKFEGMGPGEILRLQRVISTSRRIAPCEARSVSGGCGTPKSDRSTWKITLSDGTIEMLGTWFNVMLRIEDSRLGLLYREREVSPQARVHLDAEDAAGVPAYRVGLGNLPSDAANTCQPVEGSRAWTLIPGRPRWATPSM
jgi:hypothetical protein